MPVVVCRSLGFNEVRAVEPGKTFPPQTCVALHRRFNEVRAVEPGKTQAASFGCVGAALGFNEVRAVEPGKTRSS